MSRNRRRPSSAHPTSRPRRVAGLSRPPVVEPVEARDPVVEPVEARDPVVEPVETPAGHGVVSSARTTRLLLVAVVVLGLAALAGAVFLKVHDDSTPPATAPESSLEADGETPMRISGADAKVAVAAAAQAAYTIVATSYADYDEQVEEAAALMTPEFAAEYRQTAGDVAEAIVASKTEVQVSVVAQGAVRADTDQVQALVFLNQYVTKDGAKPLFTPYRALVTVVNTDQGWLVSDLETK